MSARYRRAMGRYLLLALPLLTVACGDGKPAATAAKPATATPIAHEAELLKLTLTAEAEKRLGIATVRVGAGSAERVRATSGEIVVPASGGDGVPVTSLSNLAQIGAQQAAADGEVMRAAAAARLARIAYDRADALVREEAGSVRARDEAAGALAAARAAEATAVAQRRLLGPAIASMGRQATLWVRVPVFGTDVGAIARGRPASIRPLGSDQPARMARPVQAPPSANAVAGTVDLFYALDNRDRSWRIGQRVAVTLPLGGGAPDAGLMLPPGAILRDIYGGEWVYERTAPHDYLRRRVEIASSAGGQALVSRGLAPGAEIVTTGAAELFGTEFGAGK